MHHPSGFVTISSTWFVTAFGWQLKGPFSASFTDFFFRKERAFSMLLLCWNIPLPLSRLCKTQAACQSVGFIKTVGCWLGSMLTAELGWDSQDAGRSSPPAGPAAWSHRGNHWTDPRPNMVASAVTRHTYIYTHFIHQHRTFRFLLNKPCLQEFGNHFREENNDFLSQMMYQWGMRLRSFPCLCSLR